MEEEIGHFRASTTRWLFGSFATRHTLTTQRIIVRQGLMFRREDEIELNRVKDVSVAYSLSNQLTGIGTLAITPSDKTTGGAPFELRDIPDARAIRERLRTLVDEARQRRRVREMDVDWE